MVCESHLISDPLYNHTWTCLNYYNYSEALFTAERIFAENPTDEAIFLLATCFYRTNGPKQAKAFLLRQDCNSPKCRYLLAKCYMDIGNYSEAENTLLGFSQKFDSPTEVAHFYKEVAPFVLSMLGEIFKVTERRKYAIIYNKKCLEINPLFWKAYTELVDLNDNVEPSEVFSLPKGVVLNNQSCLRALSNKINIGDISHPNCPSKKKTDIHDSQEYLSVSRENVNPKFIEKSIDTFSSGDFLHLSENQLSYSFNSSSPHVNNVQAIEQLPSNILLKYRQNLNSEKSIKHNIDESDIEHNRPLFGHLYSNQSHTTNNFIQVLNTKKSEPEITSINESNTTSSVISDVPKIAHNTHRISFGALTRSEISTPIQSTRNNKANSRINPATPYNPIRRRHNVTFSPLTVSIAEKPSIIDSVSMTPSIDASGPRTRLQSAKAAEAQKSCIKDTHSRVSEVCCEEVLSTEADNTRLQSTAYYLQLLTAMGRSYKLMRHYRTHEAVTQMKQLPKHHLHTAIVSTWMAKVLMEKNEMQRACTVLSTSYQIEPWQLHGVPMLSSVLWMLNKEKELMSLALDMREMDRTSAAVWCAFGNCMSRNRESEVAVRYFQRVIQIEPTSPTGYLLLGHEYLDREELDKALISYRKAFDLDPFNYSASFHIASVYQSQTNYSEAERILRDALKLSPDSYILLTNLAVVIARVKKNYESEVAMEMLERACRLYPSEPLCKFHKANYLFQNGRYHEALVDLKQLNGMPEARIHLLFSAIYRQLGQPAKSVFHMARAREMDPRGTAEATPLFEHCATNSAPPAADVNAGHQDDTDSP